MNGYHLLNHSDLLETLETLNSSARCHFKKLWLNRALEPHSLCTSLRTDSSVSLNLSDGANSDW
jgi:uncharacterized protein (DUF1501 family)